MRLVLGNVWTYVEGPTRAELDFLRTYFTIEVRGARNRPTTTSLLVEWGGKIRFPSGWVKSLCARAARFPDHVKIEIADPRQRPCAPDWSVDISYLRDSDQRPAVEALVRAEQGLLEAPTAVGKSIVSVALVQVLHGARWGFFVADASLPLQMAKQYRRFTGQRAGLVGSGHWSIGPFTICMTPTLYARYRRWCDGCGQALPSREDKVCPACKGSLTHLAFEPEAQALLRSFTGIVCDEAHGAASDRETAVLRACTNAFYRYGLSATCSGRSDQKDAHVVSHFGKIVHMIEEAEVAAQGNIARLNKVQMLRCDQPRTPAYVPAGYHQAIVTSKTRNGLVVALWRRVRRPILTFVVELDHVKYLSQLATDEGIPFTVIEGKVAPDERQSRIAQMEAAMTDLVIATNAAKQGVDFIHIRTIINASGQKAVIPLIQKGGRGKRVCFAGLKGQCPVCQKYGVKDSLELYDFYDLDSVKNQMSLLATGGDKLKADQRSWLERHSLARLRAYKKRYDVEII